jgi:hypothetical protein
MMKKINIINWFSITGLLFILAVGCDSFLDVDPCTDVTCENDGICFEGVCICPTGFIGLDCQFLDPTQVQALLTAGITPIELFNADIPLESLYGKRFEDGFIFYLNTDDGTGLVAATTDQSMGAEWGCFGNDILGLPNIGSSTIPDPETEIGARIGDGAANTDSILMECSQGEIAALLARSLGPEWFLPARGALNLMWENLADSDGNGENTGPGDFQNLGGFSAEPYWSSSEGNSDVVAWFQNLGNGTQLSDVKNSNFRVRAIKAF